MNKLTRGAIYNYAGAEYEIAYVSPRKVHVVKIIGGSCKTWCLSDFRQFIAHRHIVLHIPGEETFQIPDDELPKAAIDVRNFRYDLVTEILAECPNYSSRSNPRLKLIINQVSERHQRKPPSIATLARWVTCFNKQNQHKNALLPKSNCEKTRFPIEIEFIIHDEIEKAYLSNRPINQSYLAAGIHIEIGKFLENHPIFDKNHSPSIRTFRRRIQKANPYHKSINQSGVSKGKRAMRAAGQSRHVRRILEYVQFDGNHLDCILVDASSYKELGRAYLTLGIDVFSRCIVSFEITYKPFSSSTLLKVLKQAYNQENGLPGGKIEKLVFDNGADYISNSTRNLISFTGSSIEMAPPNEPNFKAHVETIFRTLNYQLIHQLPGTTFSNPQERDGYDSVKMAGLTIEKLREHINRYIKTYHNTIHEGMSKPPLKLWKQSFNRYTQFPINSSELDVQARKVVQVSISKGRVRHLGLKWFSHSLRYLEEMLKQRNLSTKVSVYIDETDITSVYVRDPIDVHQVLKAQIVDPWHIEGLSYDEYISMREKLRKENLDPEYLSKDQALILRAQHLREIWEEYDSKKKRRRIAIKSDGNSALLKEQIDDYESEIDTLQQKRSLDKLKQLEQLKSTVNSTFKVLG